MTPGLAVLLALGGGAGAVARFFIDAWLSRHSPPLPVGTLVINLSGSLLLGLVVGALGSEPAAAVLGTGFCGGCTTFSTASVEIVRLWVTRGLLTGWGYALGSLVGCVLAAALGLALGGPAV